MTNPGAIFITARVPSNRLSQKHLQKVGGIPILQYLVNRITHNFVREIGKKDLIVAIVTRDQDRNKVLEQDIKGVPVIYGDPDNIPRRHLDAAKKLDVSFIVAVDGDDVLCSIAAMRAVYGLLRNGCPFVRTEGLPFGLNVWGYTRQCLEGNLARSNAINVQVLETGWGRIFSAQEQVVTIHYTRKEDRRLRFTLDYLEDLELFRAILTDPNIGYLTLSDERLIAFVLEKQLYRLNAFVVEQYWETFNKQKEIEISKETKPS